MKISEVFKGKPVEYTSDQVKRIIFPPLDTDSDSVIYEGVTAKLKKYVLLKAQPTKKPLFLKRIFKGENINGYLLVSAHMTGAGFNTAAKVRCLVHLYMPKDSQMAIPHWDQYGSLYQPIIKKTLKDFPGLYKTMESWDFDKHAFYHDPAILLPMMDKTYAPLQPTSRPPIFECQPSV